MRVRSWELVGLDQTRVLLFAAGLATFLFAVVAFVGETLGVGSVAIVLAMMAAACGGYLVVSAPRRIVKIAAFQQTLEAPSFAASSNIYLRSTSSTSRTLLMLRADEPHLRSFIARTKRLVLLGYDPVRATAMGTQAGDEVFSESAKAVVASLASAQGTKVEEGADELDGFLNSEGLEEETKLPVFIAVSFFLPIMLMLFAAMAKQTGPEAMGALVVLEVVILDLTLAVSGSSLQWAAGKGRGTTTGRDG